MNNNYTQDGYGAFDSSGHPTQMGGSYSECANSRAPGVSAIDKYLASLPYKPMANCKPGSYYLLNNYNAGYNVDGSLNTTPGYTVPPQKTDYVTIGNELSARHISWGYFGEGYNNGHPNFSYCGICDPMQYSASIMTNPTLRKNVQHGLNDFVSEAANGTLPAVSFLKPGDDDGHPAYSTLYAYENFVARAIAAIQGNKAVALDRDLHHRGRVRRLLRLRLHPAGELPRRRSPGADAGGVPVCPAGIRGPHLHRPRVDPEVHRGELGPEASYPL